MTASRDKRDGVTGVTPDMDDKKIPLFKRSIGCNWVFRIKRKTNGTTVKFKARFKVSALVYIATFTISDIIHAVREAAKHYERHGKMHWIAVKCDLQSSKGTADYGAIFGGNGK